jgi:hypothetical protein
MGVDFVPRVRVTGRPLCFPVLTLSHPDTFRRILAGEAAIWAYRAKNCLKEVFGDEIYSNVRNQSSNLSGKITILYQIKG